MTAPSTDDLIARLRQAANGSGGAGGPRCLQTAAADRLETLRKAAEGMAEALARQSDNMAFVLNHMDVKGWHGKFTSELAEDRAALAAYEATK